jgi:hypothetical protein
MQMRNCADKKSPAGSIISDQLCRLGRGNSMRLTLVVLLGFASVSFLGCANTLAKTQKALEESQRRYTELVRWGEIEGAVVYVDPAVAKKFLETAERFENIRVTDFESGPLEFGADSDTATVNVTYHAYSTKTLVEKKFREKQEWYLEKDTEVGWKVRPDLDSITKALSGKR